MVRLTRRFCTSLLINSVTNMCFLCEGLVDIGDETSAYFTLWRIGRYRLAYTTCVYKLTRIEALTITVIQIHTIIFHYFTENKFINKYFFIFSSDIRYTTYCLHFNYVSLVLKREASNFLSHCFYIFYNKTSSSVTDISDGNLVRTITKSSKTW